jgi:hypothetical protein
MVELQHHWIRFATVDARMRTQVSQKLFPVALPFCGILLPDAYDVYLAMSRVILTKVLSRALTASPVQNTVLSISVVELG